MTDPLVSIIVPVYNVEDYISECVESIQKQTYTNLQIILVDDGSTDRSGLLCDEYAKQDPRISVIHQPNEGPVAARGQGLKYAQGTYIGFVDSDDSIAPDMYQALVNEMETSGADFVHSGFWGEGQKIAADIEGIIDISKKEEKVKLLETAVLGGDWYISPSIWSKLFRAKVIIRSHMQVPKDIQLGEDLINLCICVLESNKIALIDRAYYYYRNRNDSLCHKETLSRIEAIFRMYRGIRDALDAYSCYLELKRCIDRELWHKMWECATQICLCFQVEKYFFKDVNILEGKRIIVFGAGRVGRDYYAQIRRYTDCKVVAWVDSHPERYDYSHIKLYNIDNLDSMEFDLLVIAVKRAEIADEICTQLIARGIDKNRIYWAEPEELFPRLE